MDTDETRRLKKVERTLELLIKAMYRNKLGKVSSVGLSFEENAELDAIVNGGQAVVFKDK